MTPSPVTPEKAYRLVLLIWAALFASIGMDYLLVAAILQPAKADPDPPLALPLLGLSILMVLASVYCRTRLRVAVQAGHIVALVLAEAPAVLGVVVFAVSGWPRAWIFFVISAVAFIVNFPKRDAFENEERV